MGRAIDTVGFFRTSGGGADTVFSAATIAPGDSFTVRAFQPPAVAEIERLHFLGEAGSAFRVRSPLLHDNVTGLQYFGAQNPGAHLFSKFVRQALQPQDTLVGEFLVNAATTTDTAAIGIDYQDLPGAQARIHSLSDIMGIIRSIKTLRVTMAGTFTLGSWLDTALTQTEDLLHANTDYAVLGYTTDVAHTAIGIKGIDTSNLRVCGPGVLDQNVTIDYFVELSRDNGQGQIPVINSANKSSTFVSVYNRATPVGTNVTLFLAELARNF